MGYPGLLASLWLRPEQAFSQLKEKPLWQGIAVFFTALGLGFFLLSGIRPFRAWFQVAFLIGLLLAQVILWLLQGWIFWRVGRAMGAEDTRYSHGMSALLAARLAMLPFTLVYYVLAFGEGGILRPPGASSLVSYGFWVRIEAFDSPSRAWALGGVLFMAAVSWLYAWFAARFTFGLKGWRAVLLSLLAL